MLIKNAVIETMSAARVIRGGWILIENGRIASVGEGQAPSYSGEIIDAEGLTALPGFIEAHSHLGIVEDSLDFEGDDCNEESDPAQPQLRAIDAVNPFDRCFGEALASGVTAAAVAPGSANPIGGQICVIKTYGKRVDKMAIKTAAAVKFALGENPKNAYHQRNESPVTRMATASIIREALYKAKKYGEELAKSENDDEFAPPEFDLKNESLLPLLKGEIAAHFHAHRADDICTALRIAEEFGIKPVILHCTEGHLIAEELRGVAVVAGPNLADRCKPELRNQTFVNVNALVACGAVTAVTTDHPVTPVNYLTLCAALAQKHGLSRYDALSAITRVPAAILGISDRVGSIEVGKDADIVLVKGDVLSLESEIKTVIVDGAAVFRG